MNILLVGTTFVQGQKRVSDSLELKFQVISRYMDDKNQILEEKEGGRECVIHNIIHTLPTDRNPYRASHKGYWKVSTGCGHEPGTPVLQRLRRTGSRLRSA